jgi:short-subunit dehydrogenase involved in D-alanine esterification of teichoic acids
MFRLDAKAPIVLVGGGGVIGRRLAPLLSRLEGRALIVAGRSAERAAPTLALVRGAGGEARFERAGLRVVRSSP